jgi:hypothetical protein
MDRSFLVRPRWLRGAMRKAIYPYYWLTAPLRPLPSALIIGTMKGGTSTLNAWLRHHPQVMFSAIKEVHFFDEYFDRGERWYRTYFPLWERWLGARCALEATPAYLYRAPQVSERMHGLVPDARLIVLLRNPVSRALSHYGHQVQRGVEQRPPAEALMAPDPSFQGKPNHYKRRGLYAQQLEQLLRFYPREQLLVLRSEDFFAEPAAAYRQVQRFLGLELKPLPPASGAENVGRTKAEIPAEVKQHLEAFYREPNRQLQSLLPDFPLWADSASG